MYQKIHYYPDDYYNYWVGWEYEGKFYVGKPEDGDNFIKKVKKVVWNFPIIRQDDYEEIALEVEDDKKIN